MTEKSNYLRQDPEYFLHHLDVIHTLIGNFANPDNWIRPKEGGIRWFGKRDPINLALNIQQYIDEVKEGKAEYRDGL